MSENVHKRSFLEVYTSEDEEKADVDSLQAEFLSETESTDSTDKEIILFRLEIGACYSHKLL